MSRRITISTSTLTGYPLDKCPLAGEKDYCVKFLDSTYKFLLCEYCTEYRLGIKEIICNCPPKSIRYVKKIKNENL